VLIVPQRLVENELVAAKAQNYRFARATAGQDAPTGSRQRPRTSGRHAGRPITRDPPPPTTTPTGIRPRRTALNTNRKPSAFPNLSVAAGRLCHNSKTAWIDPLFRCRCEVAVSGGATDAEVGGEFPHGFAGLGETAELVLALSAEFGRFGYRQLTRPS
jgi:hypothetical protein